MALVDFQTALGRMMGTGSGEPLQGLNLNLREGQCLEALSDSLGFLLCKSIQRSWCIGRAAKSAHLTLSFLSEAERQALLNEWIDSGAGTESFFNAEAGSFLDFIARRLPNPSHQLSVCRLEQATLRAEEGRNTCLERDVAGLDNSNCVLRRGQFASLVTFYAQPQLLLRSLRQHEPLPPISSEATQLLFAPGVDQLCYIPSEAEKEIWDYLETPRPAKDLTTDGENPAVLKQLLRNGVIEYA